MGFVEPDGIRQKNRRVRPDLLITLTMRKLPAQNLKVLNPKRMLRKPPFLQCRVAETGELLMQARIVDERIKASTDATKVRVVENIGHGRVARKSRPASLFTLKCL